jgi:murein DD-endopeptidase MepM/ murein hydrolase activator NlpD
MAPIQFEKPKMKTHLGIAAAFAALAGCAASGPAPIEQRIETTTASRSQEPPPPRTPRPHPATPAPDWAEGPGAPLSTWALQPEEAQPFDPAALAASYTVRRGDTLFDISARHQIPLRALIDQNRLAPPFLLEEGQVLQLPKPRFHRVTAGETLARIADRYSVDPRSLALLNRLAKPFHVRPGDDLVLPALARDSAKPAKPQRAVKPATTGPKPVVGPSASAGGQAPPKPATEKPAFALAWPVKGAITTGFGPLPGGRRSDGVDIAAPPGPIRAAADGQVVYAGADLPAYGNLMLVQHTGGWVTAYAHAAELGKKIGDKVKKGDVIAAAGPAGSDGKARVHFQIRRGSAPADPVATLGPI